MAKYRSIQTGFWSDSKVIDDFTPEDRYFYLYLLTNEKSNQLGCYELSIKQMCRDTGYNEETIKKLLDRFENVLEVVNYDFKTKEIFLKNWYKYNWLNSDSTKACIDKEFTLVKSTKLIDLISPLYAPYIPHGGNKKKKNNKNNNKKNNKNKKNEDELTLESSSSPSLPLIISFGQELGIDENYCKNFFDYYEDTEWENKDGEKIKNWKLVFRNWLKKDKKKIRIEMLPSWFNKDIKKEEATQEEMDEMKKLLEGYK